MKLTHNFDLVCMGNASASGDKAKLEMTAQLEYLAHILQLGFIEIRLLWPNVFFCYFKNVMRVCISVGMSVFCKSNDQNLPIWGL